MVKIEITETIECTHTLYFNDSLYKVKRAAQDAHMSCITLEDFKKLLKERGVKLDIVVQESHLHYNAISTTDPESLEDTDTIKISYNPKERSQTLLDYYSSQP